MSAAHKMLRATLRSNCGPSQLMVRNLTTSSAVHAVTKFTMPAMSPTMTAGGLAAWKVKEGQSFSAGDVLLEIETDKATMDVEAQDDGILAKIVVQDGAKDVSVGKVIAMLAEEGDDISNVQVPKEESQESSASSETSSDQEPKSAPQSKTQTEASTAKAAPSSSGSSKSNTDAHTTFKGPLFPSVQRLIAENHIDDAESKIKGTGIRGMITKGDVLAFLGKAKSPTGTFKEAQGGIAVLGPKQASPKGGSASSSAPAQPLSGDELRSLILGGLAAALKVSKQPTPALPVESEPVILQEVIQPVSTESYPTRLDGIRLDDPLWDLI